MFLEDDENDQGKRDEKLKEEEGFCTYPEEEGALQDHSYILSERPKGKLPAQVPVELRRGRHGTPATEYPSIVNRWGRGS